MTKLVSRWPAIAAVLVGAQVVAAYALKPGASQLKYAVVVYLAIIFVATGAAVIDVVQSAGASRIFWAFIASSYGLLWLIDWLWVYYVLVLHQEDPSGWLHPTVFFLRPVPLMVAATTYPHHHQPRRLLYRTTLNLVLLLFSWVFIYAYFVFSYRFLDINVFQRRYVTLYSVENVFLLLLLGGLIARSRTSWKTLYWHLFGASCLWTVTLQLQNYAMSFRGYRLGGWLDVPAVASCCWFAWVPLLGQRLAPQLLETTPPAITVRKYLSLWAMLVVIAIPVIGAWEVYRGDTGLEIHRFRLFTILVSFVFVTFAFFAKEHIANRELVDDITSNLRLAEERFYKAFDSNPEGISISTVADGRYLEANDAYLKMMGYKRSEVLGHTALALNVWCNPEERRAVIEELLREGRVRAAETRFRTKSGEIRDVEMSIENINLQGQSCLLAITRDITRHKLLEQQLLQAKKLEAIGRLAGSVAHDFNNVLGVILGCSELVTKDVALHPGLAKKIEMIKAASLRGASLTAQLLAFSRRQVLHPRVIDLNSAVSETTWMLTRLMGEDIEQRIVLDPGLGLVKADPGQIAQVIMNLALNARDAMPNGGQLSIETTNATFGKSAYQQGVLIQPGNYVVLTLRDTGMGMDADVKTHIFEPFFTTKEPGKGTGLGLATVSGIIEQSGGNIIVESAPGQGTTFKVYLPRVHEGVQTISVEIPLTGRVQGSGTVLLVEDDPELRGLIQEALTAGGYEVLIAGNGVDALRVSEQHSGSIDVLVTDVIMPKMSGPELARLIVARRLGIQVLYISGYQDDKLRHALMSDPDAVLIQKPFQLADLSERLRELLSGRKQNASGQPAE